MTRADARRQVGTSDVAMLLALPAGFAGLLALPWWPAGWWLWAVVGGLLLLALAAARGERLSQVSRHRGLAHPNTPLRRHNRRSESRRGV